MELWSQRKRPYRHKIGDGGLAAVADHAASFWNAESGWRARSIRRWEAATRGIRSKFTQLVLSLVYPEGNSETHDHIARFVSDTSPLANTYSICGVFRRAGRLRRGSA